MGKNLALWFGWLILLLLLAAESASFMGLLLFFSSLLIPGLILLVSRIFCRRLSFGLCIEELGEKEQEIKGKITVVNQSIFPFPVLRAEINTKNLLTTEEFETRIPLGVGGKGQGETALETAATHCGRLRISVSRILCYDFFGIISFSVPCDKKTLSLVLPSFFPAEVLVAKSGVTDPECDTFSPYQPGNDVSETFGIREYREGDPLSRIHWKLTGKLDELMIREAGLPLNESVLFLFERVLLKGKAAPSAAVSAALCEIAVSLSQALTERNCAHSIGWIEAENKTFVQCRVDSYESFQLLLPQLLAAERCTAEEDTVAGFLMNQDQYTYSNIVYISPYYSEQLPLLPITARKTAIICSEEEGEAAAEDIFVFNVTPKNYENALYEI